MLAFAGLAPALPTRGLAQRTALSAKTVRVARRNIASTTMVIDPVSLHDTLHHTIHHLTAAQGADFHSLSLLLSDAAAAVDAAADTVVEAKKSGWWDSFVHLVESAVVALHTQLLKAGVPGAYGISIILFTICIKAVTFPLNYKQLESTMRMQALTPRIKKIQNDYKDNPTVLQQMTAQLYKEEQINPLAGCLPVFVQIPVWIALYRSVLNLASDNLLNESFLWLPSLQGPVSKTGQGLSTWLFPLIDGAPPVGWHDAICYLVLPFLLMGSQFYSQKLMSPPSQDPQQQQATKFLKFMPLLIGWFSLNVPSGLGVYWLTNNVVSTAQTVFIRSRFPDLSSQATSAAPADSSEEDAVPVRNLESVDGFRSSNSTPTPTKTTKSTKSKKRRKRR